MGRKGNLAVFERYNISKTGKAMPTKLGVHALHIHPYLHELFEVILFAINYVHAMNDNEVALHSVHAKSGDTTTCSICVHL